MAAPATDLKIRWDSGLMEGDLFYEDRDLVTDQGLAGAVLISLFTDRRARPDDFLPDPYGAPKDRRGWWGDKTSEFVSSGDQIGSRLWLLERSKTEDEVLVQAVSLAKESLQWMVTDGVVARVDVSAERQTGPGSDGRLALLVSLYKTDGRKDSYSFSLQWDATMSEE